MPESRSLLVSIAKQCLYVLDHNGQALMDYPVSTSKYGTGSEEGSFKTPLGKHIIKEKIGQGEALNQVFIGRQPVGILEQLKSQQFELPEDIITTRILRLDGQEPGINRGDNMDSFQRYIYIHGTSDEENIGMPVSHGCVRMRNNDIVELFDTVASGCVVIIE